MDYFKKCYVINLDRRADKYDEFLKRIPFDSSICTRFSAIDGRNIIKFENNENPYIMGCHLSHKAIFQNVINDTSINDEDYIIIFEDDVFFQDTFIQEIEKIKTNKDLFDINSIIYIGGRFIPYFYPTSLSGWNNIKENIYIKNDNKIDSHNSDRTTHTIILSKFACKEIINKTKHVRVSIPIDVLYTDIRNYIPEMKLYDLFPHVCYSPPDYKTDIQNYTTAKTFSSTLDELISDNDINIFHYVNEEPGIGNVDMTINYDQIIF